MERHFRRGVLLLLLMLGSAFSMSCNRRMNGDPPTKIWQKNTARISDVLPILNEIESCEWYAGIAEDRSGGLVPGPSSGFIRGYAVISKRNIEKLLATYKWSPSEANAEELDLPDGAPRLGGKMFESPGLIRKLLSISTYPQGKILLRPEDRFVYFDLLQD